MARSKLSVVVLLLGTLVASVCCLAAAVGQESSDKLAKLKKESIELGIKISALEDKLNKVLEPSDDLLTKKIMAVDATAKTDPNPSIRSAAQEELKYYKALQEMRKLGQNEAVGDIAELLKEKVRSMPFVTKNYGEDRKNLAEYKKRSQEIDDEMARLGGRLPKVDGTEQILKPTKDDYATYLGGIGWTADERLGLFRIIPGNTEDPIAQAALKIVGLDKAMTYVAQRRGPDYVIESQEYLQLARNAVKLFSDSNTSLEIESSKMVITPVGEDLLLAIYLTGTATSVVDEKVTKTKLGLDAQGKPTPLKFVLTPDKTAKPKE